MITIDGKASTKMNNTKCDITDEILEKIRKCDIETPAGRGQANKILNEFYEGKNISKIELKSHKF